MKSERTTPILSPSATCSTPTSSSKSLNPSSGGGYSTTANTSSILKCNHCDYFAESRFEIEQHLINLHPQANENDFIVIPTNPMQAAAAALAFQQQVHAVAALAQQQHQQSKTSEKDYIGDDDIKSEKMDEDASEEDCTLGGNDDAFHTSTDDLRNTNNIMCPLCQDSFTDKKSFEKHLMTIHHVNNDGLARLLNLVDTSQWPSNSGALGTPTSSLPVNKTRKSPGSSASSCADGTDIECTHCSASFKSMHDLYQHSSDTQHYLIINDMHLCILRSCQQQFPSLASMNTHFNDGHMNAVISERHVYKYRCRNCSLAFKTQEKFHAHLLYHKMRDATTCNICKRNLRSTASLQKHMEQFHQNEMMGCSPITSPRQEKFHNKDFEVYLGETSPASSIQQEDSEMMLMDMQPGGDDGPGESTETNEMEFTQPAYSQQHCRSPVQRRSNDKMANHPLEKYHDPNRPFKCEICRESFTQKSILLVHYNSVSHLHKVKKQSENNNTPSTSPTSVGIGPSSSSDRNNEFDRRSVEFDRKSIDYDRKSVDSNEVETEQNKRKLSPDNDYDSPKKRFKCDICKVAYAQGSTLDIHMRSVLHQTRACRLQEQQQLQQIQQQQGLSSALLASAARLQDHSSISPTPSNLSGTNADGSDAGSSALLSGASPKFNDQIYKTLLENFGFDIVKQFNEINKHSGNASAAVAPNEAVIQPPATPSPHPAVNTHNLGSANANSGSSSSDNDKYFCRHCKKIFSSVFVLKTHCEEMHNEKIPLDFLENFAEKFKAYYMQTGDAAGGNDNEILDFSAKKEPSTKSDGILTHSSPSTPKIREQLQSPSNLPTDLIAKQLNFDPLTLAQKMMEHNMANLPQAFGVANNLQNLQNLQSLQNLQNLPNLPNLPGNMPLTFEMMQLLQFQQLMSFNYMNLAPPLIFGATGASNAQQGAGGDSANSASNLGGRSSSTSAPSASNTDLNSPASVVAAAQQVQMLQQQAAQAAAVQQVHIHSYLSLFRVNLSEMFATKCCSERLQQLSVVFDRVAS